MMEGIKFEVFNLCVVDEKWDRENVKGSIMFFIQTSRVGRRESRERGKNLFPSDVIPF